MINYHKTTEDEKYEICEEALALSRESYPGKTIYLEVRTWNLRAVKCYEKAGFNIDGEPIKQTVQWTRSYFVSVSYITHIIIKKPSEAIKFPKVFYAVRVSVK